MKRGFTLIELMIALAVFSVFGGFVYKTYYDEIRISNEFNKTIDLEYNTSKVMKKVANKIREENKFITLIKEEDDSGKGVRFIYNKESLVEVSNKYNMDVKIYTTQTNSIDVTGTIYSEEHEDLIYISVVGRLKEDETNKVILSSTINIGK